MSEFAPSYHEAGHAVAAQYFGLGMTHVSIRWAEDSLGRCSIQNGHTVDDFTAAVVMVAGQVAERMAVGKDHGPTGSWTTTTTWTRLGSSFNAPARTNSRADNSRSSKPEP
jgi:hypothetical protein